MLHGIDISMYEPRVDWPRVVASGKANFVFIRAGQGIVPDPLFKTHWAGAKSANVPRGAYWVYDPRYKTVEPQRQAEKFIETLDSDYGELPLVADIEAYTSGPHHGWKNWEAFLKYTKRLLPEYLKARWDFEPIMIYTGFYYWRDEGGPGWWQPDAQAYFAKHLLWLAFYGNRDGNLLNTPDKNILIPLHKWKKWTFWQYADSFTMDGITNENGQLTSVDMNIFAGNRETFNTMFKLFAGSLPPPADVRIRRVVVEYDDGAVKTIT